MEIREVLKNLREKNHLTQDQMAERVMVTRQAVSRWETGETQPNTDTLKLLSKEFDVSINTLLGSPRQLVCQCCGMPLPEDSMLSREPDGSLLSHMPNPDNTPEGERRVQFDGYLSQLKHWKK